MSKKPWKSPQLIVLVRGKVEENVMCVCKEPAGRPFSHRCVPAHGHRGSKGRGHGRPSRRIGKS